VKITDLTIRNASSGIKMQYTNESFFKDTDIQTSVTGFESIDSAQCSIHEVDLQVNNTNFKATNCHFFGVTQTGAVDAQAGHGFELDTVTNSLFSPLFSLNSSGDGLNVTDCANLQIDGVFIENGGDGAEFVSGNSDITLTTSAFENNGSDGVKLTASSDNVHIMSSSLQNNGGYGLNIAASTCDNATIIGNNFAGNTTAAHTDSGTGTIIVGNSGVSDNTSKGKNSGVVTISASGSTTVTCGFKPGRVRIHAVSSADSTKLYHSQGGYTVTGGNDCIGYRDGTASASSIIGFSDASNAWNIDEANGGATKHVGVVDTITSTGFDLNNTKSGTPSDIYIYWEAEEL